MIAVQNLIPPAEMSIAMAVLVFSLNMGASLFLQFSTVIFSQSLQSALPKYAPKIDPKTILAAGATHFRQVIPVDAIPDVLKAYSESITHVFYLLTALAAAGFVSSSLMGMKRIRKTKPAAQDSDIALENTDSAPKNSGTG